MATAPKIGNLPAAPNRQQPANFSAKGDALLSSLQGFATEANALGDFVEEKAGQVAIDKAAVDANVPLMNNAVAAAPLALSYRDTAKAHKDSAAASEAKALQYKNDAASAVVYQDLASIALSKNITMVDGCIDTSPNPPLAVQRRTSWFAELGPMPLKKVVIGTASDVTIYNGDDPAAPVWCTFNASSNSNMVAGNGSSTVVKTVKFYNGLLFVGKLTNSHAGLSIIDFYGDSALSCAAVASSFTGAYKGTILDRNGGKGWDGANKYQLVHQNVNALAVTIIPAAPVSPVSGLQVPTVAVATDMGISIIDGPAGVGTVVDVVGPSSPLVTAIAIDKNNRVFSYRRGIKQLDAFELPITDTTLSEAVLTKYDEGPHPAIFQTNSYGGRNELMPVSAGDSIVMSKVESIGPYGLTILNENTKNPSKGMVAQMSESHATGWMVGDIRACWMSSTEIGLMDGTDLVPNGDFSSADISAWVPSGPTKAIVEYDNGQLVITGKSTGTAHGAYLPLSTVAGQRYMVVVDMDSPPPSNRYLSVAGITGAALNNGDFKTGVNMLEFVATGSVHNLNLSVYTVDQVLRIDSVSVKQVIADRSVKGKGLAVRGDLGRGTVATGAELTAYGQFSGGVHPYQPYNTDLDFGLGDFYFSTWMKGTDGYAVFLDRRINNSTLGYLWGLTPRGDVAAQTLNINGIQFVGPDDPLLVSGQWTKVELFRQGGILYFASNGVIRGSATGAENLSTTADPETETRVGVRFDDQQTYQGQLCWMKLSGTSPTPEQLIRAYKDERPMFQPNAKVTLYGTTGTVTALGFDEITGLLHAGTGEGRSDFAGLVRVGHTDTPISTKIVAHDGMILEQ